jgi:hypothetical protein
VLEYCLAWAGCVTAASASTLRFRDRLFAAVDSGVDAFGAGDFCAADFVRLLPVL